MPDLTTATVTPRQSRLDRHTAMTLAATEYQRVADQLATLAPHDWSRPTCCDGWDVRAMAGHLLGMAQMAASPVEQVRQLRAAARLGGDQLDALTAHQVTRNANLSPDELVDHYRSTGARAVRSRRRTPALVRRVRLPGGQRVGDHTEPWTMGYLVDTILTRDPWLHRTDIHQATGAALVLTPEHDGVIVEDVVTEWLGRHGAPVELTLTGPAGGRWSQGSGGELLTCDAVEFCRVLSGRGTASGLLRTAVPF